MIIGQVNSRTEAVIAVMIRDAAGQVAVLDAVIDTGFSGYLTLPIATITALQLSYSITRTLLFVGQESDLVKRATEAIQGHHLNVDVAAGAPVLRVLDKRTGRQLWQVSLPDNETGAQMTYELHSRQYIVVPTGGLGQPAELVALAVQ